jgi:hypothetical protein
MKRSIMLMLLVAGIQLLTISYRMNFIKSNQGSKRGFTHLPAKINHVRIIDSTASYIEFIIKENTDKTGLFINDPVLYKNLSREVRHDTLILRMKELGLMSDYGRTLTIWLHNLCSLHVTGDMTIAVSTQFTLKHKHVDINVNGGAHIYVSGLRADSVFLTTSLMPELEFTNDTLHVLQSIFQKAMPGITIRHSLIDQVLSAASPPPVAKK